MAICGYPLGGGFVCGQVEGHEETGVPHMHMGQGTKYWTWQREHGYPVYKGDNWYPPEVLIED